MLTDKEFINATLDLEDHFQETWQQCMSDYLHGYKHYENIPKIGQHFPAIKEYLEKYKPLALKRL
jgi:hypothetical protein